ncbi:MAG: hypothetical protein SFZ02_02265 [bacterium]|nr:hypothetical protein [bacterium]
MRYFFNFNLLQRYYELTDDALIYESANRMARQKKIIRWDKIIGAGYYRMNKDDMSTDVSELRKIMPPGVGKLMNMGIEIHRMSDMILLVYQVASGRRTMLYMHVKVNDPETHELVTDMHNHLGARWHNTIDDMHRYRREMGLSNGWVWVAVVLFVLIGSPIMIMLMVGWELIQQQWGLYILAGTIFFSGILLLWRWMKNRPRKTQG